MRSEPDQKLMQQGASRRWVLCETAPWGHRMRLPGHHLTRWLVARGDMVAYVSVPVSPWHFLDPKARALARRRWHQEGAQGRWRNERLFTYIPRTLLPVHRRAPFDSDLAFRWSHRLTVPNAQAVLEREGFGDPDVAVVQSVLLAPLAESLGPGKLVLRIEDAIEHFAGMPRVAVRQERVWLRRADLVTATAPALAEHAVAAGARRVHLLPNGVNVRRFHRKVGAAVPEDWPRGDGPVAVYVGALDSWFDEELLATVARRLPQWRFVLIGPPARPFASLRALGNVFFLGPRAAESVPPYLWAATAGIIPFRRTPLIETVCPLKLFEYLAAGLPVVATRWSELERLRSPAMLADSAEAFGEGLERARTRGEEERRAAVEWAAEYDWGRLFRGFAEMVE